MELEIHVFAEFQQKSEALHLFAKAVKKYYKAHGLTDYMSSPLEAIWDTYDNSKFDVTRKELIKFTLMIVQPSAMTQDIFEAIKEELLSKKHNAYIKDIYFKRFKEVNVYNYCMLEHMIRNYFN